MKREQIEYLTTVLIFAVLLVICALVFISRVIPVLSPFIIALAVAGGMRRPARFLSGKLRVPERIVRLLLSLFAILAIFTLAGVLIWQTATSLFKLLTDISEDEAFLSRLLSIFERELPIFEGLPDGLYDRIGEALGSMISGALSSVASFLSTAVATVPGILLFITVTVIAIVYFALDLDRVYATIDSLLPRKMKTGISEINNSVISLIWKYIKSYLAIMLITFTVMMGGLMILGVENALIISVIIAFLDILPIIGVGTVLIPWSIFAFLFGNAPLGIGLIVLFFVNAVIRQLSEPKIVGKNLDLHPLLTLIFIYVGYSLFGVLGIVVLPIVAVSIGVYLKKNAAAEVAKGATHNTVGDE